MGYLKANNQYAKTFPVDMVAGTLLDSRVNPVPAATPATTSAAGTTTTPAVELGDRGTLRLALILSAITATSLTVTVQTSFDNGATDSWRTVGSAFAAQTAAGTVRQDFPGCDRFVRASVVQAGAGAVTYTLSGEAC